MTAPVVVGNITRSSRKTPPPQGVVITDEVDLHIDGNTIRFVPKKPMAGFAECKEVTKTYRTEASVILISTRAQRGQAHYVRQVMTKARIEEINKQVREQKPSTEKKKTKKKIK